MARFPLFLILLAACLCAQEVDPPSGEARALPKEEEPEERDFLELRFTPRAVYRFGTPLKDGGRFDAFSASYGVGVDFNLAEGTVLGVNLDYGSHTYRFTGNRGFGGFDPWERVQTLRLGLSFRTRIGRYFGLFASPSLRYAAEPHADFEDSLTWGAIVGFSVGLGRDLQVGLGVSVSEDLEGDYRVFPLPYLRWGFAEGFTLSTRLRTLSGGGLELAYAPLEELELGIGIGVTGLEWRNNDDTIGSDSRWPLLARVSYAVNDAFELDVFGGVLIEGELELEGRRGERIERDRYDPQPFVGLQLTTRF